MEPVDRAKETDFAQKASCKLQRLIGEPETNWRSGQLEAIEAIVQDRGRALVVQRTGWGKSAVYLISTRLIRDAGGGPTVIVSPLLALMRNQLLMTDRLGIKATTVNSTNRQEWQETFEAIQAGEIDFLLITPERLNNPEFRREVMPELFPQIGLLVIDEVHCISEWGHDFRPDYRRLEQVVNSLPPSVPVLGTTATANDRVVNDIEEQLGSNLRVFRGTLERQSLSLQVLSVEHKAERMAWLAEQIPNLRGSGIVYCLTVRDAERVACWLKSRHIDAEAYTGRMDNQARIEIENRLTSGELHVVVATSALGMGYDNPYIEFVVHYQTPGSAIAYYQQVGRAGRAVERSYGIAMSGREDKEIQDFFIETAFPSQKDTELVLDALRETEDGLSPTDIVSLVNLRWSRIDSMLKILEVEGAVYRDNFRWRRSARRWQYPIERIEKVTASRRAEQAAMAEYVSTGRCLMEFLREQLDDPGAERCGRCANCAGPVFTDQVDEELVETALAYLEKIPLVIYPRKKLPCELNMDLDLRKNRLETGRSLARWGDPLAQLVKDGKYQDVRFDNRLVTAAAEATSEWGPSPSPTWLTWIPSSRSGVVEDFARRLADALALEAVESLVRVRESAQQKTMQNSCQQARNVAGTLRVVEFRLGPVLLVDDMVDSRWTLTIAGSQLISAGSGPVYPLALADTSGVGD